MRYFIIKDGKIIKGHNTKPDISLGEKLIESKADIRLLQYAYLVDGNKVINCGPEKRSTEWR